MIPQRSWPIHETKPMDLPLRRRPRGHWPNFTRRRSPLCRNDARGCSVDLDRLRRSLDRQYCHLATSSRVRFDGVDTPLLKTPQFTPLPSCDLTDLTDLTVLWTGVCVGDGRERAGARVRALRTPPSEMVSNPSNASTPPRRPALFHLTPPDSNRQTRQMDHDGPPVVVDRIAHENNSTSWDHLGRGSSCIYSPTIPPRSRRRVGRSD